MNEEESARVDIEGFYRAAGDLHVLDQPREEPPVSALQRLGAAPFPKSKFPFLGFLASVYDHLAAHAAGRATSATSPSNAPPES